MCVLVRFLLIVVCLVVRTSAVKTFEMVNNVYQIEHCSLTVHCLYESPNCVIHRLLPLPSQLLTSTSCTYRSHLLILALELLTAV